MERNRPECLSPDFSIHCVRSRDKGTDMNQDPALPGLLHDLNNIFQTLVDAADLLSEDPRWTPLSAAILRSVERGRRVSFSLQAGHNPGAPFDTLLENAIAFVEDSLLAGRGPAIQFACDVEA